MTIEHRRMKGVTIRAAAGKDGLHTVTLQLIKPGAVDDYGTLWDAHALDAALSARMPVLCWSHDWSEPLGRGVSFETSDDGPQVTFEFDDFDSVPMAKRAYAQTASGTIQDCSIGFSRVHGGTLEPNDDLLKRYPGIREHIVEAVAEETSLVIRGAVPGAKVLQLRTAEGATATVSEDFVVDLARQVAAGSITAAEAKIALDLAAGATPPAPSGEVESIPDPTADAAEAEALIDAALDTLG
jgi:HK97 family phage prohead protease